MTNNSSPSTAIDKELLQRRIQFGRANERRLKIQNVAAHEDTQRRTAGTMVFAIFNRVHG